MEQIKNLTLKRCTCPKAYNTLKWLRGKCNALSVVLASSGHLRVLCSLSHCLQLRLIRHGSSGVLYGTSFIPSSVSAPFHPLITLLLLQGKASLYHDTMQLTKRCTSLSASHPYNTSLGSIPLQFVIHELQSRSVHSLPTIPGLHDGTGGQHDQL
jgi:hypothetical protein